MKRGTAPAATQSRCAAPLPPAPLPLLPLLPLLPSISKFLKMSRHAFQLCATATAALTQSATSVNGTPAVGLTPLQILRYNRVEIMTKMKVLPGVLEKWLSWPGRNAKDAVELQLDADKANPDCFNLAVVMTLHPRVQRPVTPPSADAMKRLQVCPGTSTCCCAPTTACPAFVGGMPGMPGNQQCPPVCCR